MAKNILIFTGDGKGKTTAALGMALRASGHGQRICIIQFMKNDSSTGELIPLRNKLGITVTQTGLGFVPKKSSSKFAAHRDAAQKGLQLAQQAIDSGNYDLLVLDEACGAVAHDLLDEEQLLNAIRSSSDQLNIVLTGRSATAALIDIADTVTEMVPIKHAMDNGKPAREGIEF